jgi:microcystin-dependent protein
MVNIFGPGHYPDELEVTSRPAQIATSKPSDTWFDKCDEEGVGGTVMDEQWLNFIVANLRSMVRHAKVTESETDDDLLTKALAIYASGRGRFCVDGGTLNSVSLAAPTGGTVPLLSPVLYTGLTAEFYPAFTNLGNATLVYNGLASKKILRADGTELGATALQVNKRAVVHYDAAANSAAGAWILSSVCVTGEMYPSIRSSPPFGSLRCNGQTIGSAASGGTARANADCFPLFYWLWTNFTNTLLTIQTDAGAATTRGADAKTDFDANKRMPLPDIRGRSIFGMDGMGTSAASRLSSLGSPDVMGYAGGADTHTLTEAELASHDHSVPGTSGVSGAAPDSFSGTLNRYSSTTPTTTGSAGGDTAHNNMPPFWLAPIMIRL